MPSPPPDARWESPSSPGLVQGRADREPAARPRFAPVLAQALVWLIAVLVALRMRSRFGWGYVVYVVLVVAIPGIGTKDFMGCGRYLLAAFPLFAVAGARPSAASVRPGCSLRCSALSAAGLLTATYLYATGFQVA